MARNRYDIDETLETPFNFGHFRRSLKYVKKHARTMILALILSATGVLFSLLTPIIVQYALDVSIPARNAAQLLLLCLALAACIVANIILVKKRSEMMARVGQEIIYDIRMDLFEHLQKLPFTYYDDRPHGKILVRVVQYVNNVSDMLSNGIINFILEIFNILFITVFMLATHLTLGLVILAGLPVLVAVFFSIKPAQRRAWQQVSNKNSNLNAYLQESINGMRVTQIFTREDVNYGIFERLAQNEIGRASCRERV